MKEQYLNKGLEIVKILNSFTYQAYLVGGVVRDYIMHNDFIDVDIATNATPAQIKEIFPNVNMEYQHLGCVTLKVDDYVFEISTFKEEVYEKTRKPSKIYYAQNLIDDVKRRDFTVNALALTDTLKVIDLVKGQKDIKRKIVRCIGRPSVRFKEDPLRILRAYNLVARFNFNIAIRTIIGIHSSNKYLRELSNYQVSKEIVKIFEAPYGKKAVSEMINYKTHKHLSYYGKGMPYIQKYFKKLSLLEKIVICYCLSEDIPENTCFDKVFLNKIRDLLIAVEATKNYEKKEKENITNADVYKYGAETLLSAVKINYYIRNSYPKLFNKVKKIDKKLPIHSISDLKLNGADIVKLNNGVAGPFVKEIMDELASEVINGLLKNEYEPLKEKALFILNNMNNPKVETISEESSIEEETKEIVKENIQQENKYSNEILKLKDYYDREYAELLNNYLNKILSGDESEEELASIKDRCGQQVKEAMLSQNPEYHVLVQKGLI
ncbi:MAG: hypothetical protein IJE45_04080 [Bacilli bacterium]|nr:hypothetical protein [Bacilli bacterium]